MGPAVTPMAMGTPIFAIARVRDGQPALSSRRYCAAPTAALPAGPAKWPAAALAPAQPPFRMSVARLPGSRFDRRSPSFPPAGACAPVDFVTDVGAGGVPARRALCSPALATAAQHEITARNAQQCGLTASSPAVVPRLVP